MTVRFLRERLLICCIALILVFFPLANTVAAIVDSEKPIIYTDTLVSNKNRATVGDTVNISVKITDNIGVSRAVICLQNVDVFAAQKSIICDFIRQIRNHFIFCFFK